MLTALVVTQTFGGDGDVVVDARVPGVLAGAIAVWRGIPIVPAMVIGAVVTAPPVRLDAIRSRARRRSPVRWLAPPPEDRRRSDGFGDEAEDADHEQPETKVPHTTRDRTQRVQP